MDNDTPMKYYKVKALNEVDHYYLYKVENDQLWQYQTAGRRNKWLLWTTLKPGEILKGRSVFIPITDEEAFIYLL